VFGTENIFNTESKMTELQVENARLRERLGDKTGGAEILISEVDRLKQDSEATARNYAKEAAIIKRLTKP
jgi:regulator of replication initiation timing